MTAPRLVFLDGLRGIAALWVVLFHAAAGHHIVHLEAALPDWLHAKLSEGHFGVPMFFVLSGFVIAYAVHGQRIDAAYFGRFMLRRSIRLGLPYWASIAVAIAFLELKGFSTHTPAAVPTPGELAAHAVYLQDVLGVHQINAVYWSLCYEMQFYLLFCALVALAQRWSFPVFAVAAAVALAWPLSGLHVPGLCLPYWHGFLLGVFTFWALQGALRPGYLALYAAALLAMWLWSGDRFTLVCVVTGWAIFAAGIARRMDSWLSWPALQFVGIVSYSLYLIHNPVMGAGFNVAYRVLPRTAVGELVALVAVLALACAFAFAFWWLIERTSSALSRRLQRPCLAAKYGRSERLAEGQPEGESEQVPQLVAQRQQPVAAGEEERRRDWHECGEHHAPQRALHSACRIPGRDQRVQAGKPESVDQREQARLAEREEHLLGHFVAAADQGER